MFAIVYHVTGLESTKGHYVTNAYHPGFRQWLRYDDSTVSAVAKTAVMQPELPLWDGKAVLKEKEGGVWVQIL